MRRTSQRGSALITAIIVLMVLFITGSGLLALSTHSMRRGGYDALRAQALGLAEAGAEKAVYYLRTTAPDGSTDGNWRTTGLQESAGTGSYTIVVQNGTGANAGKLVVTSTGAVQDGSTLTTVRRTIRVALVLTRENVSIWNNAIFGGVGQAGKSLNGNVVVRGSVHLLGDGEPYTDVNGNGKWDAAEVFTDLNGNGQWDVGEPYIDANGNGKYDAAEPFTDQNGNGTWDPPLTRTDLSASVDGTASIGNNYDVMPSSLKSFAPDLATTSYNSQTVQTLNAKLRAKHGFVSISGSATIGNSQATFGLPLMKGYMDGTFVSDGFGGNQGSASVFSDNGFTQKYDLANMVTFPNLTDSTVQGGVSYSTYMAYLAAAGLNVNGNLSLQAGNSYGPISDGNGNYLAVDSSGNITIHGIVYVKGDIDIDGQGNQDSFAYSGRGTLVSTGNIHIGASLMPTDGKFPINHAMGFIARKALNLATEGGDSQLNLAGAFYAQNVVNSQKQNQILGTFVSSYYSMTNVPHMYQVPALADPNYLPPGMPGAAQIWVKTLRIDSWRETSPGGG